MDLPGASFQNNSHLRSTGHGRDGTGRCRPDPIADIDRIVEVTLNTACRILRWRESPGYAGSARGLPIPLVRRL